MNRYAPHIYVIPEDDRDRQIADGFVLHHRVKEMRIQVVPPAGGWSRVLETFRDEYITKLRDFSDAHIVLLIDFDDQFESRKAVFEQGIPIEFKSRVFVIGSKQTPEALKNELNQRFENIGTSLANECVTGNTVLWDHEQLSHNESERERLFQAVQPFLFWP